MVDVGYFEDRSQRMARQHVQERWQDAYAPVKHMDPVLLISAFVLAAIGMVMIYSATSARLVLDGGNGFSFVRKQVIALIIGTAAMIVATVLDYRLIRSYAAVLYGGALVLLVVVLTPLGTNVNGSQRWIDLGGFNLQPSELAKLAVIAVLAALLHEQKSRAGLASVAASIVLVVVPMGLVLMEPDLGTAIVFAWLTFVMFLVGGVPVRYLVGLVVGGVGSVALALQSGLVQLEPYQLSRLTGFLDAGNTALASSVTFQTEQSLIAIGSGGLAGQGYLQGLQNTLAYVPENHTDFIFTIVGEEFGFLGSVVVLGLYAVLVWRGFRIAMMAKDLFGTLLAAGIVGLLTLQIFVNIGMTVGIMPVTGIPLPFLSYGGTSLIVWLILIGVLLNVHMRRFTS